MAALTANRKRYTRGPAPRKGDGVGVDSDEFYEGQLLSWNTSGKLVPSTDTSGERIAGVCTKRVTTGASNTLRIEFEFGHEEWFPGASATVADLEANVCVTDDNTYGDNTTTNDVEIGKLKALETLGGVAGGWIHIGVTGLDAA
jgi:hypothetical protein